MALFPKVQSPCPYKDRLASIMEGDVCRMCKRQVFDLTGMSDGERVAFMQGCTGEVCVTYRMAVRPAIAAAALAVAAIAVPGVAAACDTSDVEVVVTGGIKDLKNVQYTQDPADAAIPKLPVIYEKTGNDGAVSAPAVTAPAKP
ncbi:MAG: hypothetical protein ACREHE_17045 [Rhizomicrobium sp.]